jgi:hypothetical protein
MGKRRQPSDRIVTFGYVGRYADGALGWMVPTFLNDYAGLPPAKPPAEVLKDYAVGDERLEVCRITIEVVPGRRKRSARALLRGQR